MNDMFASSPIPLAAQIACVEREIALRRRVYPRWVEQGRMSQDKANCEIAAMTAALESLSEIRKLRASITGKSALIDGISKLQGQRGVLVQMLADALKILQTIDGDEDEQLRAFRNRISMTIGETARSERAQEFALYKQYAKTDAI